MADQDPQTAQSEGGSEVDLAMEAQMDESATPHDEVVVEETEIEDAQADENEGSTAEEPSGSGEATLNQDSQKQGGEKREREEANDEIVESNAKKAKTNDAEAGDPSQKEEDTSNLVGDDIESPTDMAVDSAVEQPMESEEVKPEATETEVGDQGLESNKSPSDPDGNSAIDGATTDAVATGEEAEASNMEGQVAAVENAPPSGEQMAVFTEDTKPTADDAGVSVSHAIGEKASDVPESATDTGGMDAAPAGATGAEANHESVGFPLPETVAPTEVVVDHQDVHIEDGPIPASKEAITVVRESDVLSGRGGGTNVHPGNRNFRDLINMHRRAYLKARKNDKPAISRSIVKSIRDANGRFLRKDDNSNTWFEIGDEAAREKTSQALRQRAPEMRKLLFDTEREEARAVQEEQVRQRQNQVQQMGQVNMGQMSPMGMYMGMNPMAPGMMQMNPMFANPYFAMANKGAMPGMNMMAPPGNPNAYQEFFNAAMGRYQAQQQQQMPPQNAPAPSENKKNGESS